MPSFLRTIRFRLTLWYVSFLMIVVLALLIGLNLTVGSTVAVPSSAGAPSQAQSVPPDNNFKDNVRKDSILGAAVALAAGSIGTYILSGTILKPIDRVTALANSPSIILADEPTGNLDSGTGSRIVDLLHSLTSEARTVIVATHSAEVAAKADRVLEMVDGHLRK